MGTVCDASAGSAPPARRGDAGPGHPPPGVPPAAAAACLHAYEQVAEASGLLALAAASLPARSRARGAVRCIRCDLLLVAADLVGPLAGGRPPRLPPDRPAWLSELLAQTLAGLPAEQAARVPARTGSPAVRLLLARASVRAAATAVGSAPAELRPNPTALDYLRRLATVLLALARALDRGAGRVPLSSRPGPGRRLRARARRPLPALAPA